MRGSSLSHVDVLQALQPFIVTVWNGAHPREMPETVRAVFEQSQELGGRGTNIRLIVLDPEGAVQGSFYPFPGPSPASLDFDKERMGRYLLQKLEAVTAGMDIPTDVPAQQELSLPSTNAAGVRILLQLEHPTMAHYQVPVVEAVEFAADELATLSYPATARELPAASLSRWFEQLYPPARMDGVGRVETVAGQLTLEPAGANGDQRFARLFGRLELTLQDRQHTVYGGEVELLLSYPATGAQPVDLTGLFEGSFPDGDRRRRGPARAISMRAVFESSLAVGGTSVEE